MKIKTNKNKVPHCVFSFMPFPLFSMPQLSYTCSTPRNFYLVKTRPDLPWGKPNLFQWVLVVFAGEGGKAAEA